MTATAPTRPADDPRPPERERPERPVRRPTVTRLVLLEIAGLLAVLGALRGSVALMAAAAVAAIVIAVAGFARSGGRWWYESVADRFRLRRRQRAGRREAAAPIDPQTSQSLVDGRIRTALAPLAPGLSIAGYSDRAATIGVGQDRGGFFAGIALTPAAVSAAPLALPAAALARLVLDGAAPLSALQVVGVRVPAPSGWLPADAPCVESYRQLATRLLDDTPRPAAELTLIAARLAVPDVGEAAASRGGGVEGVHRALAAAVNRVGGLLSGAEIGYEVLTPDTLRDAVTLCCGIERAGPQRVTEAWTGWRVGDLVHVTFEISRWPAASAPELLSELAQLPAARVVTSVVLSRSGGRVGVRTLVRMAAPAGQLLELSRTLQTRAARLGVAVRRVDGRHGPAVYASAPTGGGV